MRLVFEMHEVNPGVSNVSWERWKDGLWVRKTEKAVVHGLLPSLHTSLTLRSVVPVVYVELK
jgi:hypothetical protein